MKNIIKDTKAFLLDLDGTVYLDNDLIGNVKETLNILRDKGIKIVYLTNNSSKTDDEYLVKLKNLDIWDDRDIFYSSLDGTVDYIAENIPNSKVYAVATEKVKAYLKDKINLSDDADTVLLTFDKELNYQKIEKTNNLIVKGAFYMATHPDRVCPAKDVFIPDLGSFIEMFKSSSGKVPDVIIGKPYSFMVDNIKKKLNLKSSEITMVGDRLHTDIKFGVNAKINTILVLSGETTYNMYKKSKVKASMVLESINDIPKYL